jgi:LasA protease
MVRKLKLGKVAELKIKFNAKRISTVFLLIAWVLPSLACVRSVIQPRDLTATAIIQQPTENALLNPAPAGSSGHSPLFNEKTPGTVSDPRPKLTPTREVTPKPPILYYTQAGDTVKALEARFEVTESEIKAPQGIPRSPVLPPNYLLIIPDKLQETGPSDKVLPDSEVVFSPSAVDFDINAFVNNGGGYLSTYREWLSNGWNTGADVIQRVAIENSINPRILLSILEYQSKWVYGQPANLMQTDYPIGWTDFNHLGLYKQLSWAVQQLSIGYYGWRAGILSEMDFPLENNKVMHFSPKLNAGSVAIQYLFSKLYNQQEWNGVLYGAKGLPTLHEKMFGNPWLRAQTVEPLYPPNLTQPELALPFSIGRTWSFTGGPHSAWGPDGALSALDLAPSSMDHGCIESTDWVTASASGKVVREDTGVVVLDLDGDGFEQTGWALLYLHVSNKDRIPDGSWVNVNDPLGHPSCEGGVATGTHVHIARKYNGEWILAGGPIPFNLNGWSAKAGSKPYEGTLEKDGQIVNACPCGSSDTLVTRKN